MGIGGFSIWELLIVLAIILLLFGTKRLRNIGSDLGSAIKGFRNSIKEQDQATPDAGFPNEQKPQVSAQPTTAPQQSATTATQAQDKQG